MFQINDGGRRTRVCVSTAATLSNPVLNEKRIFVVLIISMRGALICRIATFSISAFSEIYRRVSEAKEIQSVGRSTNELRSDCTGRTIRRMFVFGDRWFDR